MKLNSFGMAVTCLALAGLHNAPAADRHVPTDYATIQAAVDAAVSGDTIHIAPGIDVEQTKISGKNLTLLGQPGTILRAFPGMEAPTTPSGLIPWRSVVYVRGSSDVSIRNLTFEGDQLADQNEPGLVGAYFLDAGGNVENCRFIGFREQTASTNSAWAIRFFNDYSGAPLLNVRVVGNTIVDSYQGISLRGAPDVPSLDFTVADNTITGVGPNSTDADLIGIRLQRGAVGEVARNTISGFSYNGDGATRVSPLAFGIIGIDGFPDSLVSLAPVRLEGNVLRYNQVHLGLTLGDHCTVNNNTFEGTAPGVRPAGLWLSGQNMQVSSNAFRDMPEGIRIGGVDLVYGTSLGVATNAQLTANGFCNVATNYNFQPLATYTVQNTLICPGPELDIQAVQLSWPYSHSGHSVEMAPAPEGPWSPLDATPFQQDGQNSVVIPADAGQHFFRLVKP